MKVKWKQLILCLAVPLAVGALSAFLSRGGMKTFNSLNKPPLSPPGWLFPVVWTILYLLMGAASYLILTSDESQENIHRALTAYEIQLAINFYWPLLFFNLEFCFLSFLWLVLLWLFILITIDLFYPISKPAGYLMIPYLLWVTFAGYLNLAICLLN